MLGGLTERKWTLRRDASRLGSKDEIVVYPDRDYPLF
jgi:hypothetical protein